MILDQVNSLRQEREQQDAELQKSQAKTHEAMTLATEEASKLKTAKDVIKSLTAQVRFFIESCSILSIRELELAPFSSAIYLAPYECNGNNCWKTGRCSLSAYVTHLDFVDPQVCIEAMEFLMFSSLMIYILFGLVCFTVLEAVDTNNLSCFLFLLLSAKRNV